MKKNIMTRYAAMAMAGIMLAGAAGCSKQAAEETLENTTEAVTTAAETEAPAPALSTSISAVEIGYGNAVILKDSAEPDEVETVAETAAEEAAEETEATGETEAAEERVLTPVTVTAENVTAWVFEVSEVESSEEQTAAEETAGETEDATVDEAEEDSAPVPAFVVEGFKINFNTPGEYVITITAAGEDGTEVSVNVEVTVVDDVAPVITAPESLEVTVGDDDFDFLAGVSAYDEIDGDVTDAVTVDTADAVLDEAGETTVKYQVKDAAGNAAEIEVPVTVTAKATASTGNNQSGGQSSQPLSGNTENNDNSSDNQSADNGNSGNQTVDNGESNNPELGYSDFIAMFDATPTDQWEWWWEAFNSDASLDGLSEDEYNQLKAYVDAGKSGSGSEGGIENNTSTICHDRSLAEAAWNAQCDIISREGFSSETGDHTGSSIEWSESLYEEACRRAEEISVNFSHDGWESTGAGAENIAMGTTDANEVVQLWYNSDGHRRNMLGGWKYGAIANYGDYWVALFAQHE